jgi:putative AbiEii toxin of type IV toxin-antitoxin system
VSAEGGKMMNRGSEWRRWEPHIHAPGTVMNNQFGGPNAWHDYLTALEQATPPIEAIAVTDYYVTDTYEEVLQYKAAGRLPAAKLIFPNVELRLDVATAKGGFVNLHLFVSPKDPQHVEELQRLLSRLQFNVMQDRFDCTRADLIRLGKKADPSITDDRAALSYGANQFKVNFQKLREVFSESGWAKKNILIAVAGGATDGTSGVREAADQTIRREIEGFADVIFAGNSAQREFWLGQRDLDPGEIRARYGGLKPCLHGSDAHKLDDVASPFGDRFSWIKGGLEFDALRQACIDPGGRAHVGAEPPASATPSQVISELRILNAPWMTTPIIPLNPGLVAIIGARGSGKTALADMIAAGCDSISEEAWNAEEWANPSFLVRARSLVGQGKVEVSWAAGEFSTRALDGSDANGPFSYERVRYLSQQFVEELCSSSGLTDGLFREIERVIFEAHSDHARDGALDFAELLEHRASRHRLARDREAEAVSQISERISTELEKEKLIATYEAQVAQKKKLVDAYTADRAKLVSAGSEKRAQRHTELAGAANQVRMKLRQFAGQRQTFLVLQDEVKDLRRNQAPEALRQAQARHTHSGMSAEQWAAFLLDYKGPVDTDLAGYVKWVDGKVAELKGTAPAPGDPNTPYFPEDTDLSTLSQALLEAEMARLEKLVSADKETQRRYTALSGSIATGTAALQALTEKLKDAQGAKDRARELQTQREEAYGRAFDALVAEQSVLEELYAPLLARLAAASGTLKKLSFSVARVANVEQWASEAEDGLIDLRKAGAFRGKGTLLQKANEVLKGAWETGDSAGVIAAMADFRRLYQKDLLDHSPVAHSDQVEFRAWSKRFAKWLFGTDHIAIRYGIDYDGVDVRKLSPGTRGIVLLLLYLALDDSDNRPLVIDQPEENLDPKSVFDELVNLFIEAKSRRQVIMVTHNANLVVNTDADQIIIAESGPHPHGALPPISYRSGGLENTEIRRAVCDILEGGEGAFQERARRLRVRLER